MNNVYLLLRNNKQTGPFSVEELMKQGLKPTDLVWIEGKSACWSYPTEIEGLKSYVAAPPTPVDNSAKETQATSHQRHHEAYMPSKKEIPDVHQTTVARNIYVSLPSNPIHSPVVSEDVSSPENKVRSSAQSLEQRAEEIKRRALAFTPEKKDGQSGSDAEIKYSRSLPDLKEEYASWIYSKNSKHRSNDSGKIAAAIIGVVLTLSAGYIAARYLYQPGSTLKEVVTVNADKQLHPESNDEQVVPEETPNADVTPLSDEVPVKKPANYVALNKEVKKSPGSEVLKVVKRNQVPANNNAKSEIQPLHRQEEASNNVPIEPQEKREAVTPVQPKKKTFGEKLDRFFSKLKRKQTVEQPQNEEKQREEPQKNAGPVPGERKARHRDDEMPPAASPENLADLIDISANDQPDKWMLGIHGLKLTVHNRSSEAVKNAAVEVMYYNEQKELLEKKVVHFSNLSPEKYVTLNVPDHRFADHIDYRLIAINN